MMGLSIQARNLCKQFDLGGGVVKAAVDAVSISIQEGERIGFIGANGAGKTSLLQMLAGIAAPTGGELEVRGKVTAIFTLGVGLRDDLSGRENIYIEGELQGRTREQTAEIMEEVVAFADLGPFIDRPLRTYSTGMKARLAFSTIVHIEPEILIIDEALSVGDVQFSKKATRKMQDLTRRGRILILVSHSMGSIEAMCTRCIWMEDGRVKLDGSPAEVTKAYIEQIRGMNESALFDRFSHQVRNEVLQNGWQIESLELFGSLSQAPVTSLVTGESARIEIKVGAQPDQAFDLLLRLSRLDGLVVLESSSNGIVEQSPGVRGSLRFGVELGHLPLNYGAYLAELEILVGGEPVARRSTLFEVVNPNPHRGGRPVLVYPATINVTRVPDDTVRI